MAHSGGAPTAHVGHGGPRPANMHPPHYQQPHGERVEKRDLASWWKSFKSRDKKTAEQQETHGIFGVPLQTSIRYANVAISLINEEGQSYIYGYVPIVVAKCGVFLKEKATDVEGIFRLAGSEKRIKELKVAFDSPDRFGKGLDWTGYTVHDAANILRRYFNQLPEPIIPLEFYELFREPLKNHQEQAVGALEAQSPSVGDFDQNAAIRIYQGLIIDLPPLNRQLLLYILDLLAVFASKSDLNKMTTANLAAIFQPGTLSHPQHDMAPQEYRLSQDVLIFLIENQDSFLIGMQGTASDPETIRDVQSGVPTPPKGSSSPSSVSRSRIVIDRSSSNASAGAESIRRWGSLRRNASVSSSKHSKRSDGGPVPVGSPSTPTGSGVHRSNTVPSRRGGSNSTQNSPRFSRDQPKAGDSPNPAAVAAASAATTNAILANQASRTKHESLQSTPVAPAAPQFLQETLRQPEVISPSSSEATTPMATLSSDTASSLARDYQTPKKDTTPLLSPPADRTERTASHTPNASSGRGFLDIFKQSPSSDNEGQRKPNKLQKKRIPGSNISSAHSSNHDLSHDASAEMQSPIATGSPPAAANPPAANDLPPDRTSDVVAPVPGIASPRLGMPTRESTNATLRAASPANSYRSTTEDTSDADFAGDDMPREQAQQPDREKKRHRWRFSRTQNKMEPSSPPSGESLGGFGSKELTTSRSTVGSSGGGGYAPPRRSFQEPTPLVDPNNLSGPNPSATMQSSSTNTTDAAVFSDSEREKKGPMRWIRGKIQEHKDKEAERRQRSITASSSTPTTNTPTTATSPASAAAGSPPPADRERSGLSSPPTVGADGRGRSFEMKRGEQAAVATPPGTTAAAPIAVATDQNVVSTALSGPTPPTLAASPGNIEEGEGHPSPPTLPTSVPATTDLSADTINTNTHVSAPTTSVIPGTTGLETTGEKESGNGTEILESGNGMGSGTTTSGYAGEGNNDNQGTAA